MATTPPRDAPLHVPQSTPVKANTSSVLPFTTTQKYRIESRTALASEMRRYLLGPMPPENFLNQFFPSEGTEAPRRTTPFTIGCYKETVEAIYERKAYEPFIETTQKFMPGFTVVNSSSHPDSNSLSKVAFDIKPDISVYHHSNPPTTTTDSSLAEIFIEFKWNAVDDPFCDVDDDQTPFVRSTKSADDTLGQITTYAAIQLAAQFRTHVYSIFISRTTARILRWDRSGAIVTEAFKYNELPHLADFFHQYSCASNAMRGRDESVLVPTPTEEKDARNALKLDRSVTLHKLSVPDANDGSRYFITPRPEPTLYSPPGRATRGFRAYDVASRLVVFLKDSWRIDLPGIMSEGNVYKALNNARVKHVPNCVASGDISTVAYHATQTQNFTNAAWAHRSNKNTQFLSHRHYRLVLDIVGKILIRYESSYDMVAAVRNALIALEEAYNVGFLHRDISPGNIIIDEYRNGWLIDWDLSKPVSQNPAEETPRQVTRTGTWQFMAAGLISGISTQHDFKDDLESSIYVLLWVTLMYSEVSNRDAVPTFLSGVLDPRPYGNIGGFGKADFLKGRSFLSQVTFPDRPALHKLIEQLAQLFSVRYEPEPSQLEWASFQWMDKQGLDAEAKEAAKRHTIVGMYDERIRRLKNHAATIALFDQALQYRTEWPRKDPATLQEFGPKALQEPFIKTGWYTEIHIQSVPLAN